MLSDIIEIIEVAKTNTEVRNVLIIILIILFTPFFLWYNCRTKKVVIQEEEEVEEEEEEEETKEESCIPMNKQIEHLENVLSKRDEEIRMLNDRVSKWENARDDMVESLLEIKTLINKVTNTTYFPPVVPTHKLVFMSDKGKIHKLKSCNNEAIFTPIQNKLYTNIAKSYFCSKCINTEPENFVTKEAKYPNETEVYMTNTGKTFHTNYNCSHITNKIRNTYSIPDCYLPHYAVRICPDC